MSGRIVSIGECMVEMAPSGIPGGFTMNFAGDTFNTAWYLRKSLPAAWHIDYVTAVGTDAVSRKMLEFMSAHGIGTSHIARLADRTVGLYLIELDGAERHFSYWRGQSAARSLARDAGALARAVSAAKLVYFSGITLAILDPEGRRVLLDTLAAARAEGAVIAFDSNLRPRLWGSHEEMCRTIEQAAARADIVLPSFDDEATFFGDASTADTALRYAAQGARLVVVKNGPGPVLTWVAGRMAEHAPVAVAAPVDTTAAGDSFNAGFLAEWIQSGDVSRSIAAACALSARVICRRGALVDVD